MSSNGGTTTTQSQNGTSNTNYSGQTYNQTMNPDWVNQAGPNLYGTAANFVNGYNPINPLVAQSGNIAGFLQGMSPYAMGSAGEMFASDRGGGYAQSAIERLLQGGGSRGSSSFGSGGGGGRGGPGGGVRDVSWRDFGSFDLDSYMSPYTQNVVDASLADLDHQSQVESARRGAAQSAAGAFGGSRHGVADAVAQGEVSRGAGLLSSQLRDQAFTRASDLIGRDQAGGLQAGMSNQQGDAAELAAATSRYNSDNATGASMHSNDVQGLIAAMQGGLGLGGLDLNRGQAFQGLGESTYGIGRQAGLDRAGLEASPFSMYSGLADMLGRIPFEQGQFGQTSGSSNTQSTMSGRSRSRESAGLSDYAGLIAMMFGLGGGG